MAQNPNPRRFYIDHADDHTVVRTVPVRCADRVQPEPECVANPQASQVTRAAAAVAIANKARRAPKTVSRLVKSTRKHHEHPA